jgi:LacI family transcriptional regulator
MATIKTVAREAGVSVATVSRVFNDSALVSEATRRRVREVATRLRYAPNGAARSLITSRTSTIGVLLPDLHGDFFPEVIRGIDQTAQQQGYHLLVSSSHNENPDIGAALRALRGRVDGLIVMSLDVDARVAARNLPQSFPVVLLDCAPGSGAFDAINIGNFDGGHAMVRHLLGMGHRRIAMIKGAERSHDAAERLRGYRAALHEAGIHETLAWEVPGDFSEHAGYRAATQLLAGDEKPTAIFAANDAMAIGALSALREHGRRIPADVAVAGFGDIPMARYMNPPLTSVHVDVSELGARATGRLLEVVRSENQLEKRQEILPTKLVIRRSCGARLS